MSKVRVKARVVAGSEVFGFSSNTNTEQVGVRVEVLEGEHAGFYAWYGFFTEKAGERAIESLKTMGWNEDWNAFSRGELPGLGDTEFELTLEWETPQDGGEGFWRATFINRIGVAMKKKMDQAEAMDFGRRMRALYGGAQAQPQTQQRGQPRQAPQTQQRAQGQQTQQRQQTQQQRPAQGQQPPLDDSPPPDDDDFEPNF